MATVSWGELKTKNAVQIQVAVFVPSTLSENQSIRDGCHEPAHNNSGITGKFILFYFLSHMSTVYSTVCLLRIQQSFTLMSTLLQWKWKRKEQTQDRLNCFHRYSSLLLSSKHTPQGWWINTPAFWMNLRVNGAVSVTAFIARAKTRVAHSYFATNPVREGTTKMNTNKKLH